MQLPLNTESAFKPKASKTQSQRKERNREKALRIGQDPRLKEMMELVGSEDSFRDLWRKRLAGSSTRASLEMVREVSSKPVPEEEEEHVRPAGSMSSPHEKPQEGLPEIQTADEVDDRPYIIAKKDAGVRVHEGRAAWEETFRTTLKRLVLDFELSDDASCKYHHLDRLHNWFVEQTPAFERVQRPGEAPNYLSLDIPRGGFPGRWAKGSPRNIDTPLSDECVVLSQSMRMKKPAHLIQLADESRPKAAGSFTSQFF
jgi:hypothetical protein